MWGAGWEGACGANQPQILLVITCSYHTHLSRSSGGPTANAPKTGCFFDPQGPQGLRGTLLVITCSHHPHLSRPPGALRHRGPKLDVSLFPRGPTGPGEPYSSALLRITPTCLDAQAAYTGCFFVPQGPQGPRGALLVITCSYHLHLSRSPGAPSALGD
jgi:hypothetical protein